MKPIKDSINLLTENEIERIYEGALEILENPGMNLHSELLLKPLKEAGAKVDFIKQRVSFPRRLVEETIKIAVEEERIRQQKENIVAQENCLTFSWHSSFNERVPDVQVSLGGGCPQYFDFEKDEIREATGEDLISMLQLGEAIPEVKTIGNPLHYVIDSDGGRVDPRMMAIKGAALIAKNTSKPGVTTLLHPAELEFLIEIGIVIRGSLEEYKKRPLFININDTESPLQINQRECEIIAALAKKGLPVFILPMPMSGITSPITLASNITVGLAEILGTWTAVKAVNSEAPVEASIITGSMDPRTGAASFSTPESILQDTAVAQILRRRLKLRCSVGVGFIDASYPGVSSVWDRCFKIMAAAACGEVNYPIGILESGIVFSPEQAMLDLDIANAVHRFYSGININSEKMAVELIREKGPGAMFLAEEHTHENYKDEIWVPRLFRRSKPADLKEERKHDPIIQAHEKWKHILANSPKYQIDEVKAKEIDKIVARAEKLLTQ